MDLNNNYDVSHDVIEKEYLWAHGREPCVTQKPILKSHKFSIDSWMCKQHFPTLISKIGGRMVEK